ncbi:MAG: hypothetical protein ABJC26_14565, partial [Gemmatimonadaceae bacterium]
MDATAELVTIADIKSAASAINGHVHRTVQGASTYLNSVSNTRVSLKLELFQKTGSFKARGVINTLRQLSPEECAAGVI